MNDREDILNVLIQAIGEEGCGIACEEATVFKDEEGWKFMLEGFMEPWQLGHTVAEAKASIREYSRRGCRVWTSFSSPIKF
jgi:hypothetical protein